MNDEVTLEEGRYGCRAVLRSGWSHGLLDNLARNAVVELELNQAKGWRGDDVAFLAELPHLKALEILDLTIGNVSQIHGLHELRRLGVTTRCSTPIDFSAFPKLEGCDLEWRLGSESLFDCISLRELFVNRYKGKDIAPFARLVNLESLAILGAPVENLQGLGGLGKLRSLRLADLRRLRCLAGLEQLTGLEELEVHTCRKVSSIGEVAALSRLKKLALNNDGDIETLKPLDNLTALEWVLFYQSTKILDGDLSPLLRQKNLARVSFQNRRHYSHRREDFGEAYSR